MKGRTKKQKKKEWCDEWNRSHLSPLPGLLPSLPQFTRPGLGWGRVNKIRQKNPKQP